MDPKSPQPMKRVYVPVEHAKLDRLLEASEARGGLRSRNLRVRRTTSRIWTARAQQGEALAKRFKNPANTLQLVIMCQLQLNRRPEMDVSPSESTN